MLVLSRNKNESIIIGTNVEITICEVRGNKVTVGISAPKSIPVHRKEVFEAIRNESVRRLINNPVKEKVYQKVF